MLEVKAEVEWSFEKRPEKVVAFHKTKEGRVPVLARSSQF